MDQEAKMQKQAAKLQTSNNQKAEKLKNLSARAKKIQQAFSDIKKETGLSTVHDVTEMFIEAEVRFFGEIHHTHIHLGFIHHTELQCLKI
jgi:hypothetical protein